MSQSIVVFNCSSEPVLIQWRMDLRVWKRRLSPGGEKVFRKKKGSPLQKYTPYNPEDTFIVLPKTSWTTERLNIETARRLGIVTVYELIE